MRREESYTAAESRLEKAWLLQLIHEFDALNTDCGLGLRPPIFEITASRRVLGSWSPGVRTIRLSGYLILNHPWWLTLQVMRHEIAHQVCSEIYGREDAGHGPLFRQACEQVGVAEAFCSASADTGAALKHLVEGGNDPQTERILDKVRKLTALGKSANEHEAALALRKANQLMMDHNLLGQKLDENSFIRRTINTGMQRMAIHLRVMASMLEEFFSVRVVLATQYDPLFDRVVKTIELLGTVANTGCAEHCYYFLCDRLDYLFEHHEAMIKGGRRTARKSFYLGLLAGFTETLQQEKAGRNDRAASWEKDPKIKEMVVAEGKLDHFTSQHFPRLRRRRGRRVTLNPDAYDQARQEGKKIRFRQPVEKKNSRKTLLLS